MDFKTIDKLCNINPDFAKFIEQTEKVMTANEKYIAGSENELDKFCDESFENDAKLRTIVRKKIFL